MEALHRLLILDRLFRNHKSPISVETLLAEVECSHSTLKRLLLALREQHGYPIVYSKEHKGYYYDHTKATHITGLWFNANELQALLIISQMLQRLQPSLLDDYFRPLTARVNKLLAATGKTLADTAKRINIIPIAHQYIASDIFLPLSQATLQHETVEIQYQDIQGHYSVRVVSPQRLVYYKNNWYLDAWCHLRQGLRTFWVAGIQSLKITEEAAKLVEEEQLASHLESSYGIFSGISSVSAHLRFTGKAAMRVRGSEWHPMQKQQINADGSVELWIPYSDHRELIMDIMRYGAEAEVLAPETLKKEMIKQFKAALVLYENMHKRKLSTV
jgi:predicted DNA-binding transcriptional regulator YafY